MIAHCGFQASLTARPGLGQSLVDALLTGLDEDGPASSGHCVVHLVSHSAADPDVVHVMEGWSSAEDDHRVFAGDAAQAVVARLYGLPAGEPAYTDHVPVHGKTAFPAAVRPAARPRVPASPGRRPGTPDPPRPPRKAAP
ncbi:antibiotic biosynthesis monooxygenase [Streptomyces sp. RO-S4]|nr:antibiotic biosynthesis monooxygenase [Streptomyces sp. RO-S4]